MVLRAIAAGSLITGMLALAVLGPQWLMHTESASPETASCGVLLQTCKWQGDEGHWQVRLKRLEPSPQGDHLQLTVVTTDTPSQLTAVLKGESMYLGEYPVALKKTGAHTWQATFTAPMCTVDPTMAWRIALLRGKLPLQGPMTLIFRASGQG